MVCLQQVVTTGYNTEQGVSRTTAGICLSDFKGQSRKGRTYCKQQTCSKSLKSQPKEVEVAVLHHAKLVTYTLMYKPRLTRRSDDLTQNVMQKAEYLNAVT